MTILVFKYCGFILSNIHEEEMTVYRHAHVHIFILIDNLLGFYTQLLSQKFFPCCHLHIRL